MKFADKAQSVSVDESKSVHFWSFDWQAQGKYANI
jgi:hypothetical protein